jgi:hypothetical protein
MRPPAIATGQLCSPRLQSQCVGHLRSVLNVPILARYAIYGKKPVVFEIGQSMTREHPDAPTIILKQRLRRIIRQSILPPGQTIVSTNPNAPICGCEHGLSSIARQTLFHRNSRYGELSKPVESSGGGGPDIAFTIL